MAANNLTPQAIGQANGAGALDALYESMFTSRLISEYRQINKLVDMFPKETAVGSDRIKEVYRGTTTSAFKTAGADLEDDTLLNDLVQEAKYVEADQVLLSQTFSSLEDLVKTHYKTVPHDMKEIAYSLAKTYDQYAAQKLILGAREAAFYTGRPTGAQVSVADSGTDGTKLLSAIRQTAQKLAERNIDPSECVLLMLPQYETLLKDLATISNLAPVNKDFGSSGSLSSGKVIEIHGLNIMVNNHMPSTNIAAITGDNNTYSGDFRESVGVAFKPDALKMGVWVPPTAKIIDSDRYMGKIVRGYMMAGLNFLRPESCIELVDPNIVVP